MYHSLSLKINLVPKVGLRRLKLLIEINLEFSIFLFHLWIWSS